MSSPRPGGGGRDPSLAKTAGFLVFSGIAISILKTLNPLGKNRPVPSEPLAASAQPSAPPPPPLPRPSPEPVTKMAEKFVDQSLHQTVEIAKGDTLWGLSQKYRVPVAEIKEANGLTGDTIYAGRKLIIP